MANEVEYKLESVPATRVAADKIDETFRSSSIGESLWHSLCFTLFDTVTMTVLRESATFYEILCGKCRLGLNRVIFLRLELLGQRREGCLIWDSARSNHNSTLTNTES